MCQREKYSKGRLPEIILLWQLCPSCVCRPPPPPFAQMGCDWFACELEDPPAHLGGSSLCSCSCSFLPLLPRDRAIHIKKVCSLYIKRGEACCEHGCECGVTKWGRSTFLEPPHIFIERNLGRIKDLDKLKPFASFPSPRRDPCDGVSCFTPWSSQFQFLGDPHVLSMSSVCCLGECEEISSPCVCACARD